MFQSINISMLYNNAIVTKAGMFPNLRILPGRAAIIDFSLLRDNGVWVYTNIVSSWHVEQHSLYRQWPNESYRDGINNWTLAKIDLSMCSLLSSMIGSRCYQ